MRIESDTIYQHDECDEILVLGVHRRYDSYDTEENTGVENGMYVRYAYEWDGYGAMPGATAVDPIDELTAAVGKKIRRFDQD